MCEGGEGFVPCEPLPRDPQTLMKKGPHDENGDGTVGAERGQQKREANTQREELKDNDQTSRVPAANNRSSPDR